MSTFHVVCVPQPGFALQQCCCRNGKWTRDAVQSLPRFTLLYQGGVEGKWIQPPSASGFPRLAKVDPLNPRNQLCGLPPSGQHPANACVRLPRLGTRIETHCQKSLHLEPRFSLVRRVPCLRCPRYQAITITEDCRVPASGCRSWRILGPGKGPASRVGED